MSLYTLTYAMLRYVRVIDFVNIFPWIQSKYEEDHMKFETYYQV